MKITKSQIAKIVEQVLNKLNEGLNFNQLEAKLDELMAHFNVDVELTRHFKERFPHERNDPAIAVQEIIELFKRLGIKYGDRFANMSQKTKLDALIRDFKTDINIPVTIEFNRSTRMLELRPKTVMRKADFKFDRQPVGQVLNLASVQKNISRKGASYSMFPKNARIQFVTKFGTPENERQFNQVYQDSIRKFGDRGMWVPFMKDGIPHFKIVGNPAIDKLVKNSGSMDWMDAYVND